MYGYRNIAENCIADELAKVETDVTIFMVLQFIGVPVSSIELGIKRANYSQAKFHFVLYCQPPLNLKCSGKVS